MTPHNYPKERCPKHPNLFLRAPLPSKEVRSLIAIQMLKLETGERMFFCTLGVTLSNSTPLNIF